MTSIRISFGLHKLQSIPDHALNDQQDPAIDLAAQVTKLTKFMLAPEGTFHSNDEYREREAGSSNLIGGG